MENYTKEVVKKLLDRAIEKITIEKDNEINKLKDELEVIKLEKTLNNEIKTDIEISKKEISMDEIDKILGGFNE